VNTDFWYTTLAGRPAASQVMPNHMPRTGKAPPQPNPDCNAAIIMDPGSSKRHAAHANGRTRFAFTKVPGAPELHKLLTPF